jgi:hypothetical protein
LTARPLPGQSADIVWPMSLRWVLAAVVVVSVAACTDSGGVPSALAPSPSRSVPAVLEGPAIREPHGLVGAGPAEADWLAFEAGDSCAELEAEPATIEIELDADGYEVHCGHRTVRGDIIRPHFAFQTEVDALGSVEETRTVRLEAMRLCEGRGGQRSGLVDRNGARSVWRVRCGDGSVRFGWVQYAGG